MSGSHQPLVALFELCKMSIVFKIPTFTLTFFEEIWHYTMTAVLSQQQTVTLLITLLTLTGIAIGRTPKIKLNRAGIALIGASLLVLFGVQDIQSAWQLIDGEIIVLLLGLMIVNTVLTYAKFFRLMTRITVRSARNTLSLLSSLVFTSGVLSAFFLNDTLVLMLTPLVLAVTQAFKRNPVPYLLALAMSANIGSVAAMTGNPQNLIVGLRSGIGFLPFLTALAPVAFLGLVALIGILILVYPKEFIGVKLESPELETLDLSPRLLIRTIAIALLMLTAFVAGYSVPAVALIAAAAMLIFGRSPSDNVLAAIDWNLLVLFSGLFIVVGSLETTGLSALMFDAVKPLLTGGVALLSGLTLVLSNILSNVPAVLLLSPAIENLGNQKRDWLTVAMSSTFAGNLTLLGSVANLIVVEIARKQGVEVSFMTYLKVGLPVTLATLVIGILYLKLI
jgi:Na+/H+ antiporter NhaD/arsenite permease-like protein